MCHSTHHTSQFQKTSGDKNFHRRGSKIQQHRERELLGIFHGLAQLKSELYGQSVNWITDCKNIVKIVKRGSMKPYILNIAIAIFHMARQNKVCINMVWVPRTQNQEADFWSRVCDFDDWGIQPVWFQKICNFFELTPTVDRFADNKNTKLPRFNARFFNAKAEAIDCFSQDWSAETNWVVPPIFLALRAIEHCRACRANMILVVPFWRYAVFWPTSSMSQILSLEIPWC